MEPTTFAEELAFEYERNVSQVVGLSNWRDEVAICSVGEVCIKLRWTQQEFCGHVKFNMFILQSIREQDPGVQRCMRWREKLRVPGV